MNKLTGYLLLYGGIVMTLLYTGTGCFKKRTKGATTTTKDPHEDRSTKDHGQDELNPLETDGDLDTDGDFKTAVQLVHLPRPFQLDLLSFLKHSDVERYRLVNQHCNTTVVQLRDQSQLVKRRVFADLKLHREIAWKRINEKGLIDGRHLRDDKGHRVNWLHYSKGLRCCRSMKRWTEELIGERIYIGTPAHTVVRLEVENEQRMRYVIAMNNELTADSAYQLVHFLKHLSGTVFTRAEIDTREEHPGQPNPRVFHFSNTRGRVQIELLYRTNAFQLQGVSEAARQAIDNVFTVRQAP